MKILFVLIFAAVATLAGGCAIVPQQEVSLSPDAVNTQTDRIGVAMSAIPELGTDVPGADCLLCLLFAKGANSTLSEHAKTLPYDDLLKLKNEMADLLRKKGATVTLIEEDLDVKALPDMGSKAPNTAKKNFSSLGKKYGIDKLVMIEITGLGFIRTYSSYFPTSDPKSLLKGAGYMVNMKDNTYSWYRPILVSKSADGNWDEPPKFPGLTNAYFQGLEIGRDSFLQPFSSSAPIAASAEVAVKMPLPTTPKETPAQGISP